jgi:lipopolysaccharide transport system ATP-binding protein
MHPDILPATRKEVHYYDKKYYLGFSWYRTHFPLRFFHKNKITGEATPYYFFHPLAAKRIKEDLPDVKLILLLRHPIERAYSHFQMSLRKNYEEESDFLKAIENKKERIRNEKEKIIKSQKYISKLHMNFSYIERGKYYSQLINLYKYFKKEQVLIIKSENLFINPNQELKKIHQFLKIRHIPIKEVKTYSKGQYQSLKKIISEEEYWKLKKLYREEIEYLTKELGSEFEWDILNDQADKDIMRNRKIV